MGVVFEGQTKCAAKGKNMSLSHIAKPAMLTRQDGTLVRPDNDKQLHFVNTVPASVLDMTVADLSRIIEQSCPGFFDYGQGVTALAV